MEIRAYRSSDERGILELYQLAFGLQLTVEEWHWYYRDAVIVVADVAGRIVGHYAVQPRPFTVRGQACVAGLVIGSMVAPEFRNVTTFLDTAKHCYELCRARGIPFVYAFPNDNVWLVRRRMLDWKALPSLVELIARPEDLVVPALDSRVERLEAGERLVPSWRDAPDAIRPDYDADFLAWRLARPGVAYPTYLVREGGELRGYAVLKHYGASDGHILALRVAPGYERDAGAALLARARRHFVEAGITQISTWLRPVAQVFEVATAAGLQPATGKGKNFGFLALDPEIAPALAAAECWDVAMLDSDVY